MMKQRKLRRMKTNQKVFLDIYFLIMMIFFYLKLFRAAIGIVCVREIVVMAAVEISFTKFCLQLFVKDYSYWKTDKINNF